MLRCVRAGARNYLAGEGVHDPADAYADEQKEEEGPQNVFYAVDGAAAAEESEGNGNDQREDNHGREMAEVNSGGHQAL